MRPGCVRRPRPARTQPARGVPAQRPVEVGAAVALQGEREIARIIDRVVQAVSVAVVGFLVVADRDPPARALPSARIGTPGLDHALRQPRALRRAASPRSDESQNEGENAPTVANSSG